MKTCRVVGFLVLFTLLTSSALADEKKKPSWGLRGAIIGQGLGFIGAAYEGMVEILPYYHMVGVPMLEAFRRTDTGEFTFGLAYSWLKIYDEDDDWGDYERTMKMWLMEFHVGYAHILAHSGPDSLRFGGRIGTALGGMKEEYKEEGYSDTDDESLDGVILTVCAYLAGDYMFTRNFGVNGELGLGYFGHLDTDYFYTNRHSIYTYSAASMVLRF